jgi:AraC family transcriptional activator of tynA and feaB
MKKRFSTRDVHPRDRLDYWHSVACNSLVGPSSTPECRQTFAAEIETGMLADIELVLFENSPMDVARAAKHGAQSQGDERSCVGKRRACSRWNKTGASLFWAQAT